jgi:hypothetical protein
MSDNPPLDLPALEGLGDPYSARADAIGCLALRLNRIEDPAAAALVTEAIHRLVLTIPLPEGAAVHGFDKLRTYQENR